MNINDLKKIINELSYDCEAIGSGEFRYIGEPLTDDNSGYMRFLADLKYLNKAIASSNILLVKRGLDLEKIKAKTDAALIIVENPKEVYYAVNIYLSEHTNYFDSYEKNILDKYETTAPISIGENSVISPMARIGHNVSIGHNVTILDNVIIEDNVVVKNNVVLGADGLMLSKIKGVKRLMPHRGFLIIESGTMVMDGCILQKGLYPWLNTVIGCNSVLGGGTIVAHGSIVGKESTIIDGSIVLGHTKVEDNAFIGAGSVLKNRLRVGRKANITFGSIVAQDVEEGSSIAGFFAIDKMKSLIHYKKIRK